MATVEVQIDRSKPLRDAPSTGHNRWHPDLPPIARCRPGDELILETRDALDGQIGLEATIETVAAMDSNVVHPLTGPIHIEGARPGDLLEVEIVDIVPDSFGYTTQSAVFGFLRDFFPDPYLVRWRLDGAGAVSEDVPGVRVPAAPFMARPTLEVADIFRAHGVASRQRRPRQPRPAQGNVGDRALSHRGARRPRRTLRQLRPRARRLQLVPQPALPQVPGRGGQGVAGRPRG